MALVPVNDEWLTALQHEADRLRAEVARLRRENAELRAEAERLAKSPASRTRTAPPVAPKQEPEAEPVGALLEIN